MLSFVLLGGACALAALCYAELASMIPQAGSAYAYSYATLGELVAWIIGWDLILEYAVGNVAVAISWGDYFNDAAARLRHRAAGVSHHRLPHGAAQLQPRRARAARDGAADCRHPVLVNMPAFAHRDADHVAPAAGREGELERQQRHGGHQAARAGASSSPSGLTAINPANYTPFAPNGWTGIHQGAAIVFFAYIGFDAISTAAEETKNPQRNLPIGILGGLAICTVIYVIVGIVLTGMVPYTELAVADPLARALELAGLSERRAGSLRSAPSVSMSAVLLVFQYGQPRIFFAMARDGLLPQWAARVDPKTRIPYMTTLVTGIVVAAGVVVGDAAETYDLTNIGTLFAFALVCAGVLVLRVNEPDSPAAFPCAGGVAGGPARRRRVPLHHVGLPPQAWARFGCWLVVGLVIYVAYGYRTLETRIDNRERTASKGRTACRQPATCPCRTMAVWDSPRNSSQ